MNRPEPPVIVVGPQGAGPRPGSAPPLTLGWLSDLHLDFLEQPAVEAFVDRLAATPVDAWLLSGDIGTAPSLVRYLELLDGRIGRSIYFTLGNHDFYEGSLAGVGARVRETCRGSTHLAWLTDTGPPVLDERVAIVGEDSWGDGRFGDAEGTEVLVNDFFLIEELIDMARRPLLRVLNGLGDAAAARLAPKLQEAARLRRQVVVVTHVPPFREAAWYNGQPSSDEYLPWFACRAVGEVILSCAREHPDTRFLVLCGHTHEAGTCSPAPNVTVHTAGAHYGRPEIQALLRFP